MDRRSFVAAAAAVPIVGVSALAAKASKPKLVWRFRFYRCHVPLNAGSLIYKNVVDAEFEECTFTKETPEFNCVYKDSESAFVLDSMTEAEFVKYGGQYGKLNLLLVRCKQEGTLKFTRRTETFIPPAYTFSSFQ